MADSGSNLNTKALASGGTSSKRLETEDEMMALVKSFPEVHLFLGYGARAQYADVDEVLTSMESQLLEIQNRCSGKPWLAVYGGDIANKAAPDLGLLMANLRLKYNMRLLAIQSAGFPDTTTDFHFICTQQFETSQVVDAVTGEMVIKAKVLYGGLRDGSLVGSSRFYLGDKFIKTISPATQPILHTVFIAGGGGIALEEIMHADEQSVHWVYIPARARFPEVYGSLYGPVHDWVKSRLDVGVLKGKRVAIVSANY